MGCTSYHQVENEVYAEVIANYLKNHTTYTSVDLCQDSTGKYYPVVLAPGVLPLQYVRLSEPWEFEETLANGVTDSLFHVLIKSDRFHSLEYREWDNELPLDIPGFRIVRHAKQLEQQDTEYFLF